jgi:hypothetical protein
VSFVDESADGDDGVDVPSGDLSGLTDGEEEGRCDDHVGCEVVPAGCANTIGEDETAEGLEGNDVELPVSDKIFHHRSIIDKSMPESCSQAEA